MDDQFGSERAGRFWTRRNLVGGGVRPSRSNPVHSEICYKIGADQQVFFGVLASEENGSLSRIRTYGHSINSRELYR